MHLLFVCTGNICRSPLAERFTAAFATEVGEVDLTAESAGVRALTGRPMDPASAAVLRDLGGTDDGFVARPFVPALAERADLVLTMGRRHRTVVLERAPRAMKRTFTLLEAAAALQSMPATDRPVATALEERGAQLVGALTRHRGRVSAEVPDVTDPHRRPPEVHVAVGQDIVGALRPLLEELVGRGRGPIS